MNKSGNVNRTGVPGSSIKKSTRHLDELDFLNTPSKNLRRPTGTPSTQGNPATLTPRTSVSQRDLLNQDPPTSPFSPVPKSLTSLSSKNNLAETSSNEPISLKQFDLRTAFLTRHERFKRIQTFNDHLPPFTPSAETSATRSTPLKFDFIKFKNPEKFHYRYMFEKLSDRSDILDRQLEEAGSILADWYQIEEWSDPTLINQEDIWAFGRICAESQDSKISDHSCWLETTRMIAHGRRIQLKWNEDLRVQGVGPKEGGIGLFPGAIVGLRGRNGGGTYFSVQEILSMPMAEPATTAPQTLLNFSLRTPIPISLVVACGPFTWDSDLDYLPFESFIDQLISEQPDCVVLLGPFVAANHSMIKSGNITQMPSAIFREKISNRLHKLVASSPRTHVILIPSPQDLLATQVVYPQAAINLKDPELGLFGRNIVCLPNPAVFSINEVVIGINNVDVLMPLRREEFFKQALVANETEVEEDDSNPTDIISRTCRHVMRQRSFYPLFPSVSGNGLDPINLDVTHLDLLKHDTVGADILILPTNFTTFVKNLDSTVVVNPKQLCKTKGWGTYAKFTIHAINSDSLESSIAEAAGDEDGLEHLLSQRCRVEIVKL